MLMKFLLIPITLILGYVLFNSITSTLDHVLISRGYYLTEISRTILAGMLCIVCGILCGMIYANSFI
jgi:hypothetical protein